MWWATAPSCFGQRQDIGNLCQVGPGDSGVDLEFDSGRPGMRDAAQGAFERPGHPAELVMAPGRGPIQADADALYAGRGQPGGDGGRDQGAVGRHDHAQSPGGAVGGDVEDIFPQQGFAAGQDDNGLADPGDLAEQAKGRFGTQFTGVRPAGGGCAAMHAGEVAVARGLPGDQAQGRRVRPGARVVGVARGRLRWVMLHMFFHLPRDQRSFSSRAASSAK
jgi:hypothetical protein